MLSRLSDWYDWPFGDVHRSVSSFEQLRRQMDRLFADLENRAEPRAFRGTPRLTVRDDGAALVVAAELPGMSEKDVEITVNANTLTLRGQRRDDAPAGYTVHRKERAGYEFARSLQLPCKIDPDHAEATMKNGVLTLTLPKAAEARPKQIQVKAN